MFLDSRQEVKSFWTLQKESSNKSFLRFGFGYDSQRTTEAKHLELVTGIDHKCIVA
jgi:hypothetical protein